ncbi:MAG: response regulator transcription factor [Ignavibacteriales bacterium]|nr:response regulator transcription factor [Ignavibacteriales bacterium]
MKDIRILIAEDQAITRMALAYYLNSYQNMFVVAEAQNGIEMINKYKLNKPDIVLCDISMPSMDGLIAAKSIINLDSMAKIIFLTMHETEDYLLKALKIGASGYVNKSLSMDELRRSLECVSNGGKYFWGKSEKEIEELKKKSFLADNEESKIEYNGLTKREEEVLIHIAKGMTSQEIAEKLNLNKRTVDSLRSQLIDKLNLKSPSHLLKYAIEFTALSN